jgi:lysyl-tRNA synthetase class 2
MTSSDSKFNFSTQCRLRYETRRSIETFFAKRDYLPVDTPILVKAPGTEVHLDYFATNWLDYQNRQHQLYLRSSPEIHLKQALATGIPRLYHLGKCFRNGGECSPWHHPEFTMLEWYESGITFEAFMDQTELLIQTVHQDLRARYPELIRNELPSITRLSVTEAFHRFAGLALIDQDAQLGTKAKAAGLVSPQPEDDFATAFFKVLIEKIEPELKNQGGVFLYDYPPSQAALALINHGQAKRFELYLDGIEMCNAFEELIDPTENRQRLEVSNQARQQTGRKPIPPDEDFLAALGRGLPKCCGNALGFDRLLSYLTYQNSLDKVVPFRQQTPFNQS